MIHQKKNRVTERPRSLNLGKAIAMAILLSARSMHDVACELACAVSMRRNN